MSEQKMKCDHTDVCTHTYCYHHGEHEYSEKEIPYHVPDCNILGCRYHKESKCVEIN